MVPPKHMPSLYRDEYLLDGTVDLIMEYATNIYNGVLQFWPLPLCVSHQDAGRGCALTRWGGKTCWLRANLPSHILHVWLLSLCASFVFCCNAGNPTPLEWTQVCAVTTSEIAVWLRKITILLMLKSCLHAGVC